MFAALLTLAAAAQADTLGPVTFSSSSDFTNNFRTSNPTTSNGGGFSVSNGALSIQVNAAGVAVFDQTRSDGETTVNNFSLSQSSSLTVSTSLKVNKAGSSLGILFIPTTNSNTTPPSSGLMALFGVDSSATNDQSRYFTGTLLSNGAAGTQMGTSQVPGNSGIDGGGSAFLTVNFTASINGSNHLILGIDSGNGYATTQDMGVYSGALFEVGIRTFDNNGPFLLDNFTITGTPAPEPTGLALLAFGGLGLLTRRRRGGR